MKILKICWMDETIKEGILTLSTGNNKFEVFSHPCPFKEGDTIVKPLYACDAENIVRVDPQQTYIKKVGNAFEHEILARVTDINEPLVCVGDILIKLGARLPGDICVGEFILLRTDRIDS